MRRAEAGLLLISIPMLIQWGGVFVFSIAGEYRYLLPFFTLPLALLPAMAMSRSTHQRQDKQAPF